MPNKKSPPQRGQHKTPKSEVQHSQVTLKLLFPQPARTGSAPEHAHDMDTAGLRPMQAWRHQRSSRRCKSAVTTPRMPTLPAARFRPQPNPAR